MTGKELLIKLMKELNPDVGKDMVIDVYSVDEEIERSYQELTTTSSRLPLKKNVYTMPIEYYKKDREDCSPMNKLFPSKGYRSYETQSN